MKSFTFHHIPTPNSHPIAQKWHTGLQPMAQRAQATLRSEVPFPPDETVPAKCSAYQPIRGIWVGLVGVGFWVECVGFVVDSEDST